MSMLVKVLLVAALVLSIMVPFGAYFLGQPSRSRYKRSLGCNCFFFFGTLALAAVLAYGGNVQAAETAAETAAGIRSTSAATRNMAATAASATAGKTADTAARAICPADRRTAVFPTSISAAA